MSSLRDRFATLDGVPMPELWSDVQRRAASLRAAEPVTSVTVRIPRHATGRRDGTVALLAATLLVALLAGAIAVGAGLVKLPAMPPAPVVSPSLAPSLEPRPVSPFPTISPGPSDIAIDGPAPWIVFVVNSMPGGPPERALVWTMRSDGSDAHEIAEMADGGPVAWSPDGNRLLTLKRAFPRDGKILVADVSEDIGPFVDTGVEEPTSEQWEAFDFAPDGERVVFMRKSKCSSRSGLSPVVFATYVAETPGANCYVLSILDLRTGGLTDLDETLVKDQTEPQTGSLELPAWSPDGTKIAYTRIDQPERPDGARDLWVVNADGTNPSRIDLAADVSVQEPRWSPDGTRISFTSETQLADGSESAVFVAELATGRLDRITIGSDPAARQLCCAEWLDNARLRVAGTHRSDPDRFWLVGLDAVPRESRLLVDLTDSLAAIPGSVLEYVAPGWPGRMFFWQPVREGRP
jgi:WD40 repeat protein